jgi:hypothetical protein
LVSEIRVEVSAAPASDADDRTACGSGSCCATAAPSDVDVANSVEAVTAIDVLTALR